MVPLHCVCQVRSGSDNGNKGKGKNGKRPAAGNAAAPPPKHAKPMKSLDSVKCWKCKAMGHYANNCPNPPAGSKDAAPNQQAAQSELHSASLRSASCVLLRVLQM